MPAPTTWQVPFKDLLAGSGGLVSQAWQFFFRAIYDRLYPLGVEGSFELENGIVGKSFDASSVNTGTDTITIAAHGWTTGTRGRFSADVAVPLPLVAGVDYFLIVTGVNTFKVATSAGNAAAGVAINLTTTGSIAEMFSPNRDVDGLKFDSTGVSQAAVDFLVQRVMDGTAGTRVVESGMFVVIYRPHFPGPGDPPAAGWGIQMIGTPGPDDSGVDFMITSRGQVIYKSSSIAGTPKIAKIYWRARTIAGKNVLYSDMGAR